MYKINIPAKFRPILLAAAILTAILLFVLVHSGSFPLGQVYSPKTLTVTTAPVSLMNKPVEIGVPGSVQSRQAVIIRAEIPGRISELNATEGQAIQAGQLLVHIQGSGEQTVSATPVNSLPSQRGDTQQAQANYDKLLKEYERYEKLYQVGGIARRQFEDTAARLQAAREALASAQEAAQSNSVGSVPARQPAFVNLTAPISGKITGLSAAVGNTVQAGQALMTLDTGGEVRVVARIEQKDLYLIHTGTQAEIVSDDSPTQPVIGQVEAIYPEAGANPPAFLTHIRVENTSGLLKQEVPVKVHFKTDQTSKAYAVPTAAIFQEQDINYIYLAVDGKVTRQQVNVGVTLDNLTEITSPLPEQAIIITGGINNIKDGDTLSTQ